MAAQPAGIDEDGSMVYGVDSRGCREVLLGSGAPGGLAGSTGQGWQLSLPASAQGFSTL